MAFWIIAAAALALGCAAGSAPRRSLEVPPPERPAPESTRGRIACGGSSCEAGTQRCVRGTTWRCVPATEPESGEDEYACDDASDCAGGLACCLSFSSASNQHRCSARSGQGSDCRQEICAGDDGAACPTGLVCVDHVCQAPHGSATCGDGQRCPVAEPVCVWANAKGRCSSRESARDIPHDLAHAVLACSRPSDCGTGQRCCTNALWDGTQCLANCDEANNGQLCVTDQDCANLSREGVVLRCLPPDGDDDGVRALPPWLRLCRSPA